MSEWKPSNQNAEESLVGAIIKFSGDRSKIFESVAHTDFYNKRLANAYKVASELNKDGSPVDYTTVSENLSNDDFVWLGMLIKTCPSDANIYAYAKIVKDKAIERESLAKLSEAMETLKGDGKTQEKTAEALSIVSKIDVGTQQEKPKHIKEIANRWLDTYDNRINNPDSAGYGTGVSGLDDILGARAIGRDDLVVIGARPKKGKTQLAVKIADHMSRNKDLPAIVFSMEMRDEQLFERFLTNGAKVSGDNFYREMGEDEYRKVTCYVGDVMDKNLFIDDRPNLSLNQIKSTCRRLKDELGELGPIFVDYLTLMKTNDAARTDLAVGENSTGLKSLAKELGSPVFLLAQLSRGVDSRTNKRPLISDLRESGSIEQDADLIMFLYRESVYVPDSELKGLTELIVAANRHGENGTAFMEMRGGWFDDISQADVNHMMNFSSQSDDWES